MKTQATDVGLECQVSHDQAGSLNLMVDIIGATRYAADDPILLPFVVLTQPLSSPSLTANPTAAQIHTLTDKKKPPKERMGRGEGFPQKRQQENPQCARSGVLRITATCKVQLPEFPASRIHQQRQDESQPTRSEQNCGTRGELQQRVGIR